MTSQSTSDANTEVASPLPQDQHSPGSVGSSVYGGRPTFALARRDDSDGATLTLYELLPEEQAVARNERLERDNPNRKIVVEDFGEVFDGTTASNIDRWSWDDWTAVKVTRLSESRFRTILPLVREALADSGLGDTEVTGSGNNDVFISEPVGIRLALGFLGVKPIQRVDRMRALCRGIARMSDEECYYWHAKCRAPTSPNGEKALRTLLTNHI